MRVGASIIPIILLGLLCDWLLSKYLKRYLASNPRTLQVVLIFNWSCSLLLALGMTALMLFSKHLISAGNMIRVMWFFTSFVVLYIPKIIGLFFFGINQLIDFIQRRVAKRKNSSTPEAQSPSNITRRKFIQNLGTTLAVVPLFSMIYGIAWGRFKFRTYHQTVTIDNLPPSMRGYKIVQISDTHLGSFGKNYPIYDKIIELINQEQADLIIHTGDLVNNFSSELDGWIPVFQKLKARVGKFAVLGNHDYGDYFHWDSPEAKQQNFEAIKQGYAQCGFRLLNNENTKLHPDVALIGVENWGDKKLPNYSDLDLALQGVEDCAVKILLSHNPAHWEKKLVGIREDLNLTLSGHTHGGQAGVQWESIEWSPIAIQYKYWAGLYQEGPMQLYVNRGLGYGGVPMRLGIDPEITVLVLS